MQFNYKLIFYIFLFHIIDTYTNIVDKINVKNIEKIYFVWQYKIQKNKKQKKKGYIKMKTVETVAGAHTINLKELINVNELKKDRNIMLISK